MNYNESVNYIHSRLRFGIKPGLERIARLLDLAGNPQNELRYIHVAGTNGKGSVCTMLAQIMKTSGLKTGLFTSPYVIDFRERIMIDGEMIEEECLAEAVSALRPIVDKMECEGEIITEFELITAAAFLIFKEKKCDIVVTEVGLGGRFDATNVIKSSECSVIMRIDYDHTAVLGDTLTQIADEKCGILRENGKTVVYPDQEQEALTHIMKCCAEKNVNCIVPACGAIEVCDENIYGTDIIYGDLPLHIPLTGEHQILNAVTAVTAARELGISDEVIARGISGVRFPARQEIISRDPLIILDGSHNPNGVAALAASVSKHLNDRAVTAVVGMLADKDCRKAMSLIAPMFKRVYTVPVDNPRSMSSDELAALVSEYCGNVRSFKTVKGAIDSAKSDSDVILCFGSLYLAGEMRPLLK